MEGIVPTMDINRDDRCNDNNGWGNGWGAAIGGFAGAALGNGWNGGWNRNGVGPAAFGETFIMDSLPAPVPTSTPSAAISSCSPLPPRTPCVRVLVV